MPIWGARPRATPKSAKAMGLIGGVPTKRRPMLYPAAAPHIETHLHSIYGKIGVLTRGAAICFAAGHGLIEPKSREG